jgi:hypothetical protein
MTGVLMAAFLMIIYGCLFFPVIPKSNPTIYRESRPPDVVVSLSDFWSIAWSTFIAGIVTFSFFSRCIKSTLFE